VIKKLIVYAENAVNSNILGFGKRSGEFEERLCDLEEIFDLALFLSVNLEIRMPILSIELIERGLELFSPSKY
jgi:hypothetical protein